MVYRIRLAKGSEVKYISQLDFSRTIERALRRAKLRVKYSKGFNKKPVITYGPALAVGITSEAEYIDVDFEENISGDNLKERLNSVLPVGIKVLETKENNGLIPLFKLNRSVFTAKIIFDNEIDKELLAKTIKEIKDGTEIYVKKRTHKEEKLVNIAPLIHDIFLREFNFNEATVIMELSSGQEGSANPIHVIQKMAEYLNLNDIAFYVNRDETFVQEDGNRIFPM